MKAQRPVACTVSESDMFMSIPRGFSRSLVLIPGWGFSANIFSTLELPYDYIVPLHPVTGPVTSGLARFLDRSGIDRISILGWSMGGLCALEYCKTYGERVDNLFLFSLRFCYRPEEINALVSSLRSDKQRALKDFHRLCFIGQRQDHAWFCRECQPETLALWGLDDLILGLKYLSQHTIYSSFLNVLPKIRYVSIFHGKRDMIAPLNDLPPLPGNVYFKVVPTAGHLPFLIPEVQEGLIAAEKEHI